MCVLLAYVSQHQGQWAAGVQSLKVICFSEDMDGSEGGGEEGVGWVEMSAPTSFNSSLTSLRRQRQAVTAVTACVCD